MYTLTYSSTRAEVWRWYWRAWARPGGLWRLHVVIAIAIGALVWVNGVSPLNASRQFFQATITWFVAAFIAMALWPQLSFKPTQRTLNVDPGGWETTIGKISGRRSWKEVRGVEDANGAIVIVSANGSALIVPDRAFGSAAARAEFLARVRTWHAEASSNVVPSA